MNMHIVATTNCIFERIPAIIFVLQKQKPASCSAKLAYVFSFVHLISVVKTRNMFIEMALNLEKNPTVNIWMHDF